MKEEEELKKEKERQAVLDNIYVMVAMVIIVAGAVGIVFAKIHFFSKEIETGFQPIHQKVTKLILEICFRSVGLSPFLACKSVFSSEGVQYNNTDVSLGFALTICSSCVELH